MKIIVFTICHNRAFILPFFLRHYESWVDEIAVFDDQSTDGSREILQSHPKVLLREWPHPNSGLDDNLFMEFAYDWYPKAAPHFDWCIWVDTDELVHRSNPREFLAMSDQYDVMTTAGFNMFGHGLPRDDGRSQLTELLKTGSYAPVYDKAIIFRTSVNIRWSTGKLFLESCDGRVTPKPYWKLLHYRYLGRDHTVRTNAQNYERCVGNKNAAWSCRPDYHGEHSATWAEAAIPLAFDVIAHQL